MPPPALFMPSRPAKRLRPRRCTISVCMPSTSRPERSAPTVRSISSRIFRAPAVLSMETVMSVFSPVIEFNRSALTLFGTNIYTAWSAHEDNGNYQGWVIAYDKTSLQQTAVFDDSPNIPPTANGNGGGSIWQASMGMVADDASIYAITSNGPFDAIRIGWRYRAAARADAECCGLVYTLQPAGVGRLRCGPRFRRTDDPAGSNQRPHQATHLCR